MKKYEFTGEMKELAGGTLHRIRAVRDFGDIKAGDIGGWIEREGNLSYDGDCWVYNNAWVYGNARVHGNARVYGNARVRGNARVNGNARVCGIALVHGNARVCGNAEVITCRHIFVIGPIGSRDDYTTFFRSADNKIYVSCGCFNGDIDEFLKKVKATHEDNKFAREYRMAAELAKVVIELEESEEE